MKKLQKSLDFLIIGGGISGLSAAFYLKKKYPHLKVQLFEKSSRFGGQIKSISHNNHVIDLGIKGFSSKNAQASFQLVQDLNIQHELIGSLKKKLNRYISIEGKLEKLPNSISSLLFLKNKMSRFLLIEAFKEFFYKDIRSLEDESVYNFFLRHFSKNFIDKFIFPLISGIYGGDPKHLSIKTLFPFLKKMEILHGSILKGYFLKLFSKENFKKILNLIPKKLLSFSSQKHSDLYSFKEGMEYVIKSLVSRLGKEVCFKQVKVLKIKEKSISNDFYVKYKENHHIKYLKSKTILLATPAYVGAKLLKNLKNKELSEILKSIRYNNLYTIHLCFPQRENIHEGLGFLCSSNENTPLLGMFWNNQIFENRGSYDQITLFYGGSIYPEIKNWSKSKLKKIALLDCKNYLNIKSKPSFIKIKFYKKAIPQFEIDHGKKIEKLYSILDKNSNIFFSSNFETNVGFNQCIKDSLKMVQTYKNL